MGRVRHVARQDERVNGVTVTLPGIAVSVGPMEIPHQVESPRIQAGIESGARAVAAAADVAIVSP